MKIISNKVNHSFRRDEIVCPYCHSKKHTYSQSHTQTLVGGTPDPNHHTLICFCSFCAKKFVMEYKHANVWYSEQMPGSKDLKLLAGIPNCFEDWVYTCSYCNGNVRREFRELDGVKIKSMGRKVFPKRDYRTFFCCESCKREEESETDHMVDVEWVKSHINVDKNLWQSKNEYLTKPYGDEEEYRAINVLRFRFRFLTQSVWYADKKNFWKLRLPFKISLSLKRTKMYLYSSIDIPQGKWVYNLPFRCSEKLGMVIMNPKGIQKLTLS
jgi:hypothetical protein